MALANAMMMMRRTCPSSRQDTARSQALTCDKAQPMTRGSFLKLFLRNSHSTPRMLSELSLRSCRPSKADIREKLDTPVCEIACRTYSHLGMRVTVRFAIWVMANGRMETVVLWGGSVTQYKLVYRIQRRALRVKHSRFFWGEKKELTIALAV
jgi:hypothetical protein